MKRKVISKGMAALLASAMVVSSFAGCGSSAAEDTSSSSTDSNAASSTETASADSSDGAAAGEYTDYSNGFPEEVTIQIPVYDRAFEGWDVTDNYYTNWIQSEFGDKYNVNVEYVAIGRTTEVQDYMQMIAAGKAPDIIMHYDMPQAVKYYNEGAIQNLDLAEIEYYAPDYYASMKDTIATYGQLDGNNAFFFAGRNAIYYNWVTLIRKDWVDAVGAEMPTTLDELNEVARKWKEAGLGTLGAKLENKSFTFEYPYMDSYVDDSDLYLDLAVAPLTWGSVKDYLKNLNTQYNEGIMDQEFYLNEDDAAFKADFVAGKTGTYSFYINSTTDAISSLMANNPDAEVAVLNPSALSPNEKYYYYKYPAYGMVMGINNDCTAEERAAVWMFLNWMSQPENLFYLQNGVEGENYTLNEDGIAEPVADFNGESKLSQNNNKDYWCLVQEVATYGDEEKDFKANLRTLAPAGYEDLIQQSYDYYKEYEQYGVVSPIFTKTVESTGEYSADLLAMWLEFYVDLATCSPDEFDAKYEEYCQEYLDGGYQAILDEKQSLLDEGSYISE